MRGILRRALLVVVLLAIAAGGGWHFYGGRARERYEARIAALRAAGQPTRFEDLATPPIPDEENGAKLLEEVARVLKEHDKAKEGAYTLLWKSEHTEEERIEMAGYLESLKPYFDLLEQVPRRPGWRLDVDWSKGVEARIDLVPWIFDASNLLRARAEFDLEPNGRTERSAKAALLLLELGRTCRSPFVMGTLVSWSSAGQATGILRNAIREPGFDASLFRRVVDPRIEEATPDSGPPTLAFIEERVYFIGFVQCLDRGDLSRSSSSFFEDRPFPFFHRPRLYDEACLCLDLTEEAIRRSNTTPEDALTVSARLKQERRDRGNTAAVLALPYEKVFAAYAEYVTGVRLARVVMALLEHRQQKGEWPEGLAALSGMPTDPFSGKPFLYERTKHGCRVRCAKEDTDQELEDRNLLWALEDDQIPAMPR